VIVPEAASKNFGEILHSQRTAPRPQAARRAQPRPAAILGAVYAASVILALCPQQTLRRPPYSSSVSSTVLPSGPVMMTQKPSSRRVLANLKAGVGYSFRP
jgi:hypothetical protein